MTIQNSRSLETAGNGSHSQASAFEGGPQQALHVAPVALARALCAPHDRCMHCMVQAHSHACVLALELGLSMAFPVLQPAELLVRLWLVACAITLMWCQARLHPVARHVLVLYVQPVLPALLMLWLWGAAVKRFTSLGIDYESCFATWDRRFLLPGEDIQWVRKSLCRGATCSMSEQGKQAIG